MPGPTTMNPTTFAWSYGSVTPLTASVGTASDTIVDVTATPTQATINNNFRSLTAKVNAIIVILQNNGTLI